MITAVICYSRSARLCRALLNIATPLRVANDHINFLYSGDLDEVKNEENTVPIIVGTASGVLFLALCCLIFLGCVLRRYHQKRYVIAKE